MTYKGVKLTQSHLDWISTYIILDNNNIEKYLDNDVGFQRIIKNHKRKTYMRIALFILLYSGLIFINR